MLLWQGSLVSVSRGKSVDDRLPLQHQMIGRLPYRGFVMFGAQDYNSYNALQLGE